MPLSYAELEQFYEGLVTRARRRGIACAITSGMACMAFGVAQATKDCDLLCAPEAAGSFLGLLASRDERLEVALKGEIEFWNQLDRLRLRVHEQAVRPYMLAVKRDRRSDDPALQTQHGVRVEHAGRLLPVSPLREHGLERLIAEAQTQAARLVAPGALNWLPDVRGCFIGLSQ